MNKYLKIFIISLGILIGVLLLGAVLVPVIFKDKITGMVKTIANNNLNATVDFDKLSLSVFKEFPDITISLSNLSVIGKNDFKNDTLARAENLSATINIMSYLKDSNVDVQSVEIVNPYVHAISSGLAANWDIMLASDTTGVKTDSDSSDFKMDLKKLTIKNGIVIYEDREANMIVGLGKLSAYLKGNMKASTTTLDLQAECSSLNVVSDGTTWISDATLLLGTKIEADLDKMLFVIKDGDCEINKIPLLLNGSVQIKGDDIPIDISYQAKAPSIKMLVDMVPASVLSDFKGLQTKGSLDLKGWVKGVYNKTSMPQVWCELKVDNGYIKYADLPKPVENINVDAKLLIDMNDDQKSLIDVSKLHLELANNPIDANLEIRTPMTDAAIKASLVGKIDFNSLKESLPLNVDMKGVVDANIKFAGRMSEVEKKQYDRLSLAGSLKLSNFLFQTEGLAVPFQISQAHLAFTPQHVNLDSFVGQLGKSDLNVTGTIDNILSYVLKNEMLKGTVNLKSKLIDCNELMSGTSATKDTTVKAEPMGIIEIPKNLDLRCNIGIDKILFDNLVLNNASGAVVLNNGALVFDKFKADFAEGQITLDGSYKAETDKQAGVDMGLGLKNMNIKSVVGSFEMITQVIPFMKNLSGIANLDFNFNTKLSADMSPDLMSLNAKGVIKADSLIIAQSENLNKIASLLNLKEKENKIRHVNASFTVKDGKIGINPFPVTLGNLNMAVGGDYGLDESIDAQMDFKIPATGLADAAKSLTQLGAIGSLLGSNTVNIGIAVGGTTSSPTFKLSKPKYLDIIGKDKAPSETEAGTESPIKEIPTKEEVKEQIEQKVEEAKKEAEGKVKDKLKDLFNRNKPK